MKKHQHMKRTLTLLLALCLLFALSACRNVPAPPDSTGTTAAGTEPAPDTTTAPDTTSAPDTSAVPQTDAPSTEAEPAITGRGVVNGDVYVNEGLKFQVKLPEDCYFYEEEQVAQANNMSVAMFEGSDLAEAIAERGQLIDMIFSRDNGDNVNVLVQPNNPALAAYSMEQVFQLSEETYRSQFSAAGMELSTYETTTVRFLGEETAALHMILSNESMSVDEYQVWATDLSEDYMAIVTVTFSTEGGDPQPLLDAFGRID